MGRNYLNTGQRFCYDAQGRIVDCAGSGQDAEFRPGLAWPVPRFESRNGLVLDLLTGLTWSRDANPAEFPLTWAEAYDYISGLNRENHLGRDDWRLPDRREMRSVISYQTRNPALPEDHPFENVFIGWRWTSTEAAVDPAYAWYVHLEGGRMFYGRKDQGFLVWPVCGSGSPVLPAISGTDESGFGVEWPRPRFEDRGITVLDNLTGLVWSKRAGLNETPVDWIEAFQIVAKLNRTAHGGADAWRLPAINELETMIDARSYNPALPEGHPFTDMRDLYASSTSSGFEPDWCMALYLSKGAVGVGQKKGRSFHVWPVSERADF